jgi:RHS repeat-associated protein
VQDDKFTYDVENRRIGKNTLSGGQSWTAYDGVNAYADFNSSGSLTYRYLFGNAIDFLLARVDTSGNPMWYLTDKLGSVRENVDGSANVLDSITYDAYGNILSESSPSNGDRFKFTGREWDSEIGQYYYRARYYGPAAGRFISEDPLSFAGGDTNLFRYVRNRPNLMVDPRGLDIPPYDDLKGHDRMVMAWLKKCANLKARWEVVKARRNRIGDALHMIENQIERLQGLPLNGPAQAVLAGLKAAELNLEQQWEKANAEEFNIEQEAAQERCGWIFQR